MTDVLDVTPKIQKVDTGVDKASEIVGKLGDLLTATYDLTIRTHAVHWNVEGPLFYAVHMLTEDQYEELFAATDGLAERMRALGAMTPMRPAEFISESRSENSKARPTAGDMVHDLVKRHEAAARLCHEVAEVSEANSDPVTADLVTARSAVHEKAAWMLRSLIAD